MINDYWISGYDLTRYSSEKIVSFVTENLCDKLVINFAFEWQPYETETFINLIDLCKQKSIGLTVVMGGTGDTEVEKLMVNRYPYIEFLYWPSYWAFFTIYCLQSRSGTLEQKPRLKGPSSFNFLAMNGQHHLHRCYAIDHLWKRNLAQTGAVNWITHRYANGELIPLEKKFDFKWFHGNEMLLRDGWRLGKSPSFDLPYEFDNSSIIFITESQWKTIFITEKTFQATLRRKPFLVVGGKGQNEFFEKNLGFKLFRDFIDYDFDQIEDTETRVVTAIDQLERWIKYPDCFNIELNKDINEILIHNHKRTYSVLEERLFFPYVVKKLLDDNNTGSDESKFILNIKKTNYPN